jgi:hypothetical protein
MRKGLPMTFVDLGVQQVKNIRAYQVGAPGKFREAASARVTDEFRIAYNAGKDAFELGRRPRKGP